MQEGREGREPHPADKLVGSRIRSQRKHLGMSQVELAKQIGGITYQQLQKYEVAENRVGAGTLFRIAQVLDVPINFFYQQEPVTEATAEAAETTLVAFLKSREGIALNRAFARITDHKVRGSIVAVVRALGRLSET